MDFLNCPRCHTAALMRTPEGRQCPNCSHTLSEVDYHIYASERMDEMAKQFDAIERQSMRHLRATFGRKRKKESDVSTRAVI